MGTKRIYSGEVNKRNGVGVVVVEEWTKGVVSVDRVSDRLLAVKLVMVEELVVVISVYGPQTGCEEGEKEKFMEELDQLVGKTEEGELLIVCGTLMEKWARSLRGLKKYMEGMDMETEIEKGGVLLRWHSGGNWWCATHGTEKRRSILSPIAVEAEAVRLTIY